MSGKIPNIVVIGSTTVDDVRIHPDLKNLDDGKQSAKAHYSDVGGGGANIAITIASLAAATNTPVQVTFLTKIGKAGAGYYTGLEACEALQGYGVDLHDMAASKNIRIPRVPVISHATGRFISSPQNPFVKALGERTSDLGTTDSDTVQYIRDLVANADLVVLHKHYPALSEIAALEAHERGIPIVIDYPEQDSTRALLFKRILEVSDFILAPAEARLTNTLGADYKNGQTLFRQLGEEFPDAFIAVSDGSEPVLVKQDNHISQIEILKLTPVDQLGAGDVRTGAFAYFTALGDQPLTALEKASRLGSLSVLHYGHTWIDELPDFVRNDQVFKQSGSAPEQVDTGLELNSH